MFPFVKDLNSNIWITLEHAIPDQYSTLTEDVFLYPDSSSLVWRANGDVESIFSQIV